MLANCSWVEGLGKGKLSVSHLHLIYLFSSPLNSSSHHIYLYPYIYLYLSLFVTNNLITSISTIIVAVRWTGDSHRHTPVVRVPRKGVGGG
jgi:hypothetical protein